MLVITMREDSKKRRKIAKKITRKIRNKRREIIRRNKCSYKPKKDKENLIIHERRLYLTPVIQRKMIRKEICKVSRYYKTITDK